METPKRSTKAKEVKEEAVKNKVDSNQRVRIKLFKDNGTYKFPLFVQVNDYRAVIPRGEWVEVPYYVAKHLEEIQEQDDKTAAMVAQLVSETENKGW